MYRAPSRLIALLARAVPLAISIALAAPLAQAVRGETARTTKIIVPFPAGGSTDILARVLAEQIGKANGPPW